MCRNHVAVCRNDAISINLRGTMNTLQAVLRHWEAICLNGGPCSGYSSVITVSVTALGQANTQNSIYSAIKAGLLSLCKSVATVGRFLERPLIVAQPSCSHDIATEPLPSNY